MGTHSHEDSDYVLTDRDLADFDPKLLERDTDVNGVRTGDTSVMWRPGVEAEIQGFSGDARGLLSSEARIRGEKADLDAIELARLRLVADQFDLRRIGNDDLCILERAIRRIRSKRIVILIIKVDDHLNGGQPVELPLPISLGLELSVRRELLEDQGLLRRTAHRSIDRINKNGRFKYEFNPVYLAEARIIVINKSQKLAMYAPIPPIAAKRMHDIIKLVDREPLSMVPQREEAGRIESRHCARQISELCNERIDGSRKWVAVIGHPTGKDRVAGPDEAVTIRRNLSNAKLVQEDFEDLLKTEGTNNVFFGLEEESADSEDDVLVDAEADYAEDYEYEILDDEAESGDSGVLIPILEWSFLQEIQRPRAERSTDDATTRGKLEVNEEKVRALLRRWLRQYIITHDNQFRSETPPVIAVMAVSKKKNTIGRIRQGLSFVNVNRERDVIATADSVLPYFEPEELKSGYNPSEDEMLGID